jgi:hypothetical protein
MSRIVYEKLIVPQIIMKFQGRLSPCSQEARIGPYPEPVEPTYFKSDLILSYHIYVRLPNLFLLNFYLNFCKVRQPCHETLQYFVNIANFGLRTIFSSLLSFPLSLVQTFFRMPLTQPPSVCVLPVGRKTMFHTAKYLATSADNSALKFEERIF